MTRIKIAEFQNRLKGLILGHATSRDKAASILEQGLTLPYNYACVGIGWMCDDLPINVRFSADAVASRPYPDPECFRTGEIY